MPVSTSSADSPAARRMAAIGRNLALITAGAFLLALSVEGVMVPHSFLTSGLFGTGIYIYYLTDLFGPAVWYFILSVPVMLVAWRSVSMSFCVYTVISLALTTLFTQFLPWRLDIENPLLAAVAGGVLNGAGTGLSLRSDGSDGGISILGVVLHRKFGLRIGKVSFTYNLILFSLGLLTSLSLDQILYSVIGIFVSSNTIEYVISMFNQRKMAMVISDEPDAIARRIFTDLRRGVTYLNGRGAFTGHDKRVILTVVYNYQLKRLEDVVTHVDPHAFLIIADTFNVIGVGFSKPNE